MTDTNRPIRILLIEDDPEDFRIFKSYLNSIKRSQFIVDRVSRYEESLPAMMRKEHDIYLLDYYLGEKTGLDILRAVINEKFNLPVIFLTGMKNSDADLEVLKYGAYDYLVKEYVNPEVLERSIKYAMSRFSLESKLRDQKILLETIIESSPVGMCVTTENMEFTLWNEQFLKMFGLKKEDLNKKINEIICFKNKKSDIYSKEYNFINSPFEKIIENKTVSLEGEVTGNNSRVYCLVKYKDILIKNGKDRLYRVFSFIDTNQYRDREDKLRDTIFKAEELIKKYAEKSKDPNAYMDLADLEVTKMTYTMKTDALGV